MNINQINPLLSELKAAIIKMAEPIAVQLREKYPNELCLVRLSMRSNHFAALMLSHFPDEKYPAWYQQSLDGWRFQWRDGEYQPPTIEQTKNADDFIDLHFKK